jgi:hypothetical protein
VAIDYHSIPYVTVHEDSRSQAASVSLPAA